MTLSIKILRAPSLADQIYERLMRAIVTLEIPPGERIVIEQIAALLEVSRTPLREALPRLIADGLLEEDGNTQLRVTLITAQYIREIFQTRAGPEAFATLLATPAIPASALDDLAGRLARVEPDVSRGEFASAFDADVYLHALVVAHCGNGYLARMLHGLHSHVDRIRAFSQKRPGAQLLGSHAEHLKLFAAISARDARKAKDLMEWHILRAGERLAQLLT